MTDAFHANRVTRCVYRTMANLIQESGRYLIHDPKKWECTCRLYTLMDLYPTILEHIPFHHAIKNNIMYIRQFIQDIRHSPLYESIEVYLILLTEQMEAVEDRLNAMYQGEGYLHDDGRVEGETDLDDRAEGEEGESV
jgi:hypothetical protein